MSVPAQDAIAQLAKAVDAVYNPNSTDQIRYDATGFLESFKLTQQPLYILQVSLEIIKSQSYTTQLRHFAFQAFEHVLENHYTKIAANDKMVIKAQILELIQPQQVPGSTTPVPSPLISYMIQQESILTSKLVSLLVKIILHDWPGQWGDLFPKLLSFYNTIPCIDYCLFLCELITAILDRTGQPSTAVPDKRRKEIFALCVKILTDFLPIYFQHFDTLLNIIACDITQPTVQQNLNLALVKFPKLQSALNDFQQRKTTYINDIQLRWYIKHALEVSMRLSQHICDRIQLNDRTCGTLFSLLSMLLCLPEVCDEASEHVLILLQRRQGVPLQYHPTTLLQVWETVCELCFRILSRQKICNQRCILFPQHHAGNTNTMTAAQFFKQQPLLVKVLKCISQLINGYSQALVSILGKTHAQIRGLQELAAQSPGGQLPVEKIAELEKAQGMIAGVNQLRTNLMQILCRAASDLDCSDLVCCEALTCLTECTNHRLYKTYITNSWFKQNNLIEPIMQELWNAVLINNDREKHALLEKKTRGGQQITRDEDDEDGLGPTGGTVQDITGQIRSSIQALVKHLADRQPHIMLKLVAFTYHNCIKELITIVQQEQQIIEQTKQFESTISNNAKEIDYVFQTSSEFNQLLYPTYHYGGRTFFMSRHALFLNTLTTLGKSIFTRIQALVITIQNNQPEINPQPFELSPNVEFENHHEIPPHHLEGLYPLYMQIHDLLTTCPQQCLGYMNYTINLLVKLTPLYTHSPQHLNQTLMLLLSIGSINPNNMLSSPTGTFIGSSQHDGLSYNSFFIEQTTQQSITNPANARHEGLASIAGSGRDGINMGPLLDLRKHAFHAILHLCKFLPQAFEATYKQFCNHILTLIKPETSSTSQQQQKKDSQFITIPTEAVVFIEILLCLALYFNDRELIESVYTTLIAPHCQFLLQSHDLAYFTADLKRFSTLMYGSYDEYKVIQLQLLQWNEANQKPNDFIVKNNNLTNNNTNTNTSNTVGANSTDNLMDLRAVALPKPSNAQILIPTAGSDQTGQHITTCGTYDNRYQALRKQLVFSIHTIQCICKLLYTTVCAGDTTSPLSIISAHKYNQTVNGQVDLHTGIPLDVVNTQQGQKEAQIKVQQQAAISREMLSSIIQQLYPTILKLTSFYMVCTTDSYISTLSTRLHPIAVTNGFDSFLALFASDGYIAAQDPTTQQQQSIYGNQTLIDNLWLQSTQYQQQTNGNCDPSKCLLSGFLDSSILPINIQNPLSLPPAALTSNSTKLLPADKSQSLLRHLWAWNDNFFEALTQFFSIMGHIVPEAVTLDLLSIPNIVQEVNNSSFILTNPLQSIDFIIKQTLVQTTPQPAAAAVSQNNNNSNPVQISSPAAWSQYTPYLWTILLNIMPSLPAKRQKLFIQRFLQPFLRAIPLNPLSSTTTVQKPIVTQHPLIHKQPGLLNARLLPHIVPSILLSLTTVLTTTIRDAIIFHKYSLSSPGSAIHGMSPTLSLLADGVGVGTVALTRRLRGNTGNLEHLRYLQLLSSTPNTHTIPTPNAPGIETLPLYPTMQSQQHILATTPFTTHYLTQAEQQPQIFINKPHFATLQTIPIETNKLSQSQQQFVGNIINELNIHKNTPLETTQFKMLHFPGEIEEIQQDISSILQRFDFSRFIASTQHQQQAIMNNNNDLKFNRKIYQGDLLHSYADQLDFAEFGHYFANATTILNMFCIAPVNNERSLSNSLPMLKQSQMFLALPMCSRLAEFSAVNVNMCYMLSTLWECLVNVNCNTSSSQPASTATRAIINFLRYVGVVLCYASICTAQRQHQQQIGDVNSPPYMLDAYNMGLYFRQLYYLQNTKKSVARENQQENLQNKANNITEDRYAGLIIKKHSQDIIQQLNEQPSSAAALVFTHDEYWLHLHQLQTLNTTSDEGLTNTFLRVAPGLLQWLQTLFTTTIHILQRHFWASTVLGFQQMQQQKEQTIGSPIMDPEMVDLLCILTRDIITLLSQCAAFVQPNTLLQLIQTSIPPVKLKPNAILNNDHVGIEIVGLLLEYARSVDVDQETNAAKSNGGEYFSYSDLINNKKGVLSEKNNNQPHYCIPTQTRPAKDQYKALLTDIILKSFQ